MPGMIIESLTLINSCCVTGASGFIGRALCSFLRARGCRITALLRRQAEGSWDETIIAELGRDDISPALLDGVEAAWLAMTAPQAPGETHIVSDGRQYSTRELYEWIKQNFGRRITPWLLPAVLYHCSRSRLKVAGR